jgi:hypothetical protein
MLPQGSPFAAFSGIPLAAVTEQGAKAAQMSTGGQNKPANIRRSSIPNVGRFGDCRRNTLS